MLWFKSRPGGILNCKPGDLFVVRNVANLIPPYENDHGYHGTSAALEFAVLGLGVEHIIIFGHSNWGGVRSLFEENQKIGPNSFIGKWMEISRLAFNKTISQYPAVNLDVKVKHCSHFALINSSKNLLTFPWINERVDSGKLFLHAWYFDIESGKIEEFNFESNNFSELECC